MALGDGKTNPFGDGAGKASGGNMAGNNFVTNPAGGASAGRGNDFLTNPSGGAAGGGSPTNFVDGSRTQQKGENVDLNKASEVRQNGGLIPLIDRPDAGAGSVGNGRKPFKGI